MACTMGMVEWTILLRRSHRLFEHEIVDRSAAIFDGSKKNLGRYGVMISRDLCLLHSETDGSPVTTT